MTLSILRRGSTLCQDDDDDEDDEFVTPASSPEPELDPSFNIRL